MNFANLSAYAELIGAAALGGLAVFGLFNTGLRARRGEDDQVAKNLIDNLKLTVDEQEKTIGRLRTNLDQTTKEMHIMQGRNSVLEGLFGGSENSIVSFIKIAPELMAMTKSTNDAVAALAGSMKNFLDRTSASPVTVSVGGHT